jgi:hypothetical protein
MKFTDGYQLVSYHYKFFFCFWSLVHLLDKLALLEDNEQGVAK